LPLNTWLGKHPFSAIDHHTSEELFITSGAQVDVWNENRAEPVHSFHWGAESVNTVRLNRIEHNLFVSSGSDRNIVLYDVRQKTPIRKIILQMQVNSLCWNPVEAFIFSFGSEDCSAYTFDMRQLSKAKEIYHDHLKAIISLDYSPTGKEFVTGSWDRTLRIWNVLNARSREVYHTARMQKIFSVKFTADTKYVLSGSEDMIIRLWKTNASEQLKTLLPREEAKKNYQAKLKEKFHFAPDIRRIARHRHLPKLLVKQKKLGHIMRMSKKRKLDNLIAHRKPGTVPIIPGKKKSYSQSY